MSEIGDRRTPEEGESIYLNVALYNGVVGFEPEFIFSDGILATKYPKEHDREYWEEPGYYVYDFNDYHSNPGIFRSVRIFKAALGEKVFLHEGEKWKGRVAEWYVSDRKSKDGRAIIYVTVRELRRRYSWFRERVGNGLEVSLKCGDALLRRRVIPLEVHLYRFRAEGDPTKTITEMKALGTPQRPVVLVDFPRRTNFAALVEAEVAGFGKLKSPAVRKVAGNKISMTIRLVDSKTLERYKNLPLAGRS